MNKRMILKKKSSKKGIKNAEELKKLALNNNKSITRNYGH
jgi:hypothetical protein